MAASSTFIAMFALLVLQVYSHRVSKAVEFMITDALLAADPCLQISAAIEDPERYCQLTDWYAVCNSQN